MALEQHNTAFEFETMLRRHLSRGGSMVEACAGFDADSASAYLENVLGQTARARYESHLAGCPSCRRHVIELSRFLQLPEIVSQPATQPALVANSETIWSKWKTAVAGWFDVSAWNRGWATAGAAAAILLAVAATQLWRQTSPTNLTEANLSANTAPTNSPSPDGQSLPSATPDSLLAGNFALQQSPADARLAVVPTPDVTPTATGNSVFASSSTTPSKDIELGKTLAGIQVVNPPLPVPSATGGRVMTTGFAPDLTNNQPALTFDPSLPPAPAATEAVATAEPAKIMAPLNPSPSDNPMTRSRRAAPTPTPKTLGTFSFLPSGKAESERKAELKEIEEGAPKLLTVRVRDKIFSFQGGMWVDHAYKPEMAWRVTKLVRDSEEYKQTLAAEPQLKEFFERTAVIVIWKDKIYKVVPR